MEAGSEFPDDFAARPRKEGLIHLQADIFANEVDAAISHQKMGSPFVHAAEIIDVSACMIRGVVCCPQNSRECLFSTGGGSRPG